MKKILIIITICLLITGCKSSTTSKDNNSIIGKWAHGSFIYTFNEDNTCSYDMSGDTLKCTYKIDDNILTITYEDSEPMELEYSLNNNKLRIIDVFGASTLYERK